MSKKVGVTVKDVPANDFVKAYAAHLKRSGAIKLPEWVDIVKTGHYKELSPYDPDWYYVRAAAVARRVYLRGGLGVGAFRRTFGANDRRGARPGRHTLAAGGVIRSVLQQLEAVKVVEKNPKGGRRITSHGQKELDRIAASVINKE